MSIKKSLYELTLQAQEKVSTYKNPDINEWRDAIDPVLSIIGENTVGRDCIDAISVDDDTTTILTSYSVRCCDQTNEISIPTSILKALEPIKAANIFRIEYKLRKAERRLREQQRIVDELTKQIRELENELRAAN